MRILNGGFDLIKELLILGFTLSAFIGLFLHPEETVRIGDLPRTPYFLEREELNYVK